jgi:large subunit ribosomal protein L24
LQGTGNIVLADAQLAGLDPRAFDAVTRAVDQGLAIDSVRISDVVNKALDSGQLPVKRVEGAISVSAGQMRLSNVTADSKDAALSVAGNLDLTDGSVDARLVLSGSNQAAGARPDIFMALKGSIAAPSRSIDVSALTGWLTLRAVENQANKLRDVERQRDAERLREIERSREIERQREAERLRQMERSREIERQHEAERLREIERSRQIESERQTAPVEPPSVPKSALPPAPRSQLAPALPAPINIKPLPAPARASRPEALVGPQN